MLTTPNPYGHNNSPIQKTSWIIEHTNTINNIGKVSSINNQTATVTHWIIDPTNNKLTPCSGCNQNDPKLNKRKCTKNIHIKKLKKLIVDSKRYVRAKIQDINSYLIHQNDCNPQKISHKKIPKQLQIIQEAIKNKQTTNYL